MDILYTCTKGCKICTTFYDDIILCLWLWLWWYFKFCMMQNNPSLPFLSLWIMIRNIMISCLIATLFFWMLTYPLPGVLYSSEFSLPGPHHPVFWQCYWSYCCRRSMMLLNYTQGKHGQAKSASAIHSDMCSSCKPDKAVRISSLVWDCFWKEKSN